MSQPYEPVTIHVTRDDMIMVSAGIQWLRGYVAALGDEDMPEMTKAALKQIDKWAGF